MHARPNQPNSLHWLLLPLLAWTFLAAQPLGLKTPSRQYASLDAEYQALLDAGVNYAKEFDIEPGVSLSQEQIAALTHDMVWLEERIVDGQKVLVPVVYLAQSDANRETNEFF
jgi:large exoprotein involved in heme utilization and adhesion